MSSRSRLLRQIEKAVQLGLLNLEPETAHRITLSLLNYWQYVLPVPSKDDPRLSQRLFGLAFPNPVGVAAGLDKDAEVASALFKFGFGFVEVGTVTPRQQFGNARPRVFRLRNDEAIINRFGFNSDGEGPVLKRLAERAHDGGIVGVNIGANRETENRVADYLRLIEVFAPVASYFTVNVSSPNTPGLRDLQQLATLDDLLARVVEKRDNVSKHAGPTPILLKISPDLTLNELDDVVGVARSRDINGMIVANTTTARRNLKDQKFSSELGGLSGRPVFGHSTRVLAEAYVRVEGKFPLVGVGGIDSGDTAIAKVRAGANLIQLYTGLMYNGIGLVDQIKEAILKALDHARSESLADLVGLDAAAMTAEPWP